MNDYESKHVEYDLYLLCKKYHQQRDELLAALKLCRFDSLNMSIDDMKRVSETVAKAEGLQE